MIVIIPSSTESDRLASAVRNLVCEALKKHNLPDAQPDWLNGELSFNGSTYSTVIRNHHTVALDNSYTLSIQINDGVSACTVQCEGPPLEHGEMTRLVGSMQGRLGVLRSDQKLVRMLSAEPFVVLTIDPSVI